MGCQHYRASHLNSLNSVCNSCQRPAMGTVSWRHMCRVWEPERDCKVDGASTAVCFEFRQAAEHDRVGGDGSSGGEQQAAGRRATDGASGKAPRRCAWQCCAADSFRRQACTAPSGDVSRPRQHSSNECCSTTATQVHAVPCKMSVLCVLIAETVMRLEYGSDCPML